MPRLPLSSYALIGANLVPLIGVLFYDWDEVFVLALFWIENLIIGVFTLLRISLSSMVQRESSGIFISAFFVLHYGLFCSIHGQLLSDLLGYPEVEYTLYFAANDFPFGPVFLQGAAVFLSFLADFAPAIWLGIGALVLSRLVSFIENFILSGEIFTGKVNKFMMRPYSQIIVMHVGLIAGATLLQYLNSPLWLLVVIVILKIIVDFKQHSRRYKKGKIRLDQNESIKDL